MGGGLLKEIPPCGELFLRRIPIRGNPYLSEHFLGGTCPGGSNGPGPKTGTKDPDQGLDQGPRNKYQRSRAWDLETRPGIKSPGAATRYQRPRTGEQVQRTRDQGPGEGGPHGGGQVSGQPTAEGSVCGVTWGGRQAGRQLADRRAASRQSEGGRWVGSRRAAAELKCRQTTSQQADRQAGSRRAGFAG